ncbi:TRAP transporter small permease [Beggiatoa alba]|nr:TRAP transporter small permease [Beggiatoa alba]
MLKTLSSLRATLCKIEDLILISLLLVAIFLAVLQIFLRNFFDTGIVWGDLLLRIIVLWIGMLGAMYASRNNDHINIELGLKYLSEEIKPFVQAVVFIFTASVSAIVAWYGVDFVLLEYQDGVMGFARVPVWLCEAIIPFAFMVIAIRYLISTVLLFTSKSS